MRGGQFTLTGLVALAIAAGTASAQETAAGSNVTVVQPPFIITPAFHRAATKNGKLKSGGHSKAYAAMRSGAADVIAPALTPGTYQFHSNICGTFYDAASNTTTTYIIPYDLAIEYFFTSNSTIQDAFQKACTTGNLVLINIIDFSNNFGAVYLTSSP